MQGSVFFPMLTSVDVSVQIKTEPILTYSMDRARLAVVLYLHTLLSGGASAAAVHTLLTSAAAQAPPQYILCSVTQPARTVEVVRWNVHPMREMKQVECIVGWLFFFSAGWVGEWVHGG